MMLPQESYVWQVQARLYMQFVFCINQCPPPPPPHPKMELELKTLELELKTGIEFFATATTAFTSLPTISKF